MVRAPLPSPGGGVVAPDTEGRRPARPRKLASHRRPPRSRRGGLESEPRDLRPPGRRIWSGDAASPARYQRHAARRLEQAQERVAESDEIHRRRTPFGRAETTGRLARSRARPVTSAAALELVRESAALAREAQMPWWESGALAELSCLSLNAGMIDEGETHARASLTIAEQLRDRPGRIFGVGILARVAAERGQDESRGHAVGRRRRRARRGTAGRLAATS